MANIKLVSIRSFSSCSLSLTYFDYNIEKVYSHKIKLKAILIKLLYS